LLSQSEVETKWTFDKISENPWIGAWKGEDENLTVGNQTDGLKWGDWKP
jgi:hypothetical protein